MTIFRDVVVYTNHNFAQKYHELLATAVIQVKSEGRSCDTMAIFDQDSEASFISELVAWNLKLKRRFANVNIECILGASGLSYLVKYQVGPSASDDFQVDMTAQVLQSVIRYRLKRNDMSHYREFADLEMADGKCDILDCIDLLIGVDYLTYFFSGQVRFSRDLN